MKRITKIKTAVVFFVLLLFSGCGVWQNFTTYFNLYFNTNKAYEEAISEIEDLKTGIFELKEPDLTQQAVANLDRVIEKGSKILQYEAESAYFNDALFLTGVAFYYKKNYAQALRKFKELALQEEEDYDLRSRLWIARCEIQLRNFENGVTILENLKTEALEKENNEVLVEAYKTLIAYYIDRQEYIQAISEAERFLEVADNDELKAQIAYHIGMLYLDQDQTEESAAAFQRALDYSPSFETEFKSKFELAKLKKQLGERQESYELLNDLYNEGKYKEFWGDVYYEIGLLEYEDGNVEKAFNIFTEVDTTYTESEGAARAELMMGEIMKNEYADYDSAKFYYDKVASSKTDPEIKEAARIYSNSVNNYLQLKNNIRTTDRKIEYALNPNEFVKDSLAYQRYLEKQEEENQQTGRNLPSNFLADVNKANQKNNDDTSESESAQDTVDQDTTTVSDSLAFDDQFNFDDFEIDEDYIVTEEPVRPQVGLDTLETEQAGNYFELGNLFFVEFHKLDSAFYYYSTLLSEFEEVPNIPRVLFALGTYYESIDQKQKADSLYTIIYEDYKTHLIANQAAEKLGKPPLIIEEDPAKDLFLEAEKEIYNYNTDSALVLLTRITDRYPESIYAPKSLYTKGWLYENVVNEPDSAVNFYSKLLDEFKNSEYASNVRNKVKAYTAEMEERNPVPDSTEALPDSAALSEFEGEIQGGDSVVTGAADSTIIENEAPADSVQLDSEQPAKIEKELEERLIKRNNARSDTSEVIDKIPADQTVPDDADTTGIPPKVNDEIRINKGSRSDSLKNNKREDQVIENKLNIIDTTGVEDTTKVVK